MHPDRPFKHFQIRAHRRRLVWRAIEFCGIGLLIGCTISAASLPLMWWRGDESLPPVIALLFISCVAGFIASLRCLPSLIDTAMLAENTLASPELLSSAMLASGAD